MSVKPNSIQKAKCKYCLSKKYLTIDHKIPKIIGGTDKPSNLQTLCRDCNQKKSGMSHKQLMNIFLWHDEINKKRLAKGKKPITFKKD